MQSRALQPRWETQNRKSPVPCPLLGRTLNMCVCLCFVKPGLCEAVLWVSVCVSVCVCVFALCVLCVCCVCVLCALCVEEHAGITHRNDRHHAYQVQSHSSSNCLANSSETLKNNFPQFCDFLLIAKCRFWEQLFSQHCGFLGSSPPAWANNFVKFRVARSAWRPSLHYVWPCAMPASAASHACAASATAN